MELKNLRHERFCQILTYRTTKQNEAYVLSHPLKAKSSQNSINVSASRLANRPDIKARLEELRQEFRDSMAIKDAEWKLDAKRELLAAIEVDLTTLVKQDLNPDDNGVFHPVAIVDNDAIKELPEFQRRCLQFSDRGVPNVHKIAYMRQLISLYEKSEDGGVEEDTESLFDEMGV